MARKVHWSEVMVCSCGARFTNYASEAMHRHNFPLLCRKKKPKANAAPAPKSSPERADTTQP